MKQDEEKPRFESGLALKADPSDVVCSRLVVWERDLNDRSRDSCFGNTLDDVMEALES